MTTDVAVSTRSILSSPPPPSVARLVIDPTTSQALTTELAGLQLPAPAPSGSVDPAVRASLDRHLTSTATGVLRALRLPGGPAGLIIDGLPIVDDPGSTPIDGAATDGRLPVAKSTITWLAERMGVFLCGYPTIAGGRFFHDVNPVRGTVRPFSSKGADLALPHHSDSAANDDRPDFLVLWSIREATDSLVLTGYAAVADALALLSSATVAELRRPAYRIQVPTIADLDDGEQWSEPLALVTGPDEAPSLRFHSTRSEGATPEAERARRDLIAALDAVTVDIELRPGRLFVLNNRRGVHRRNAFTPTYGPDERWLLRSYLMADPWSHRRVLVAADAMVATGDGPAATCTPGGVVDLRGDTPGVGPAATTETDNEIDLLLAAPDRAVRHLLPDIDDRPLDGPEAMALVAERASLLPFAITAHDAHHIADGGGHHRSASATVLWADLGDHDPQEWQLVFALEAAVRSGAVGSRFTTGLDVFDGPAPTDALEPTGFVFHMSRCGSTLISRALARSSRHVVQSQPGVLRDGIWSVLTDGWRRAPQPSVANLDLFRRVVAHLLRDRSDAGAEAGFVKFYSENVLFLDFIRAAFPTTPCLFVFRDPVEVVASIAGNSTGMLAARRTARAQLVSGLSESDERVVDDQTFITHCLARYLDTVLASSPDGLTVLDYRHLNADNFEAIVADAFRYRLPPEDRTAILDQFGLYSKADPARPQAFVDDSARKRASVPVRWRRQLDANLGPRLDQLRARGWEPGRGPITPPDR